MKICIKVGDKKIKLVDESVVDFGITLNITEQTVSLDDVSSMQ